MSEDLILRDEKGNPLGKTISTNMALLKLFSFLFPETSFEIHEMEENVVKKYFREYRERKEGRDK